MWSRAMPDHSVRCRDVAGRRRTVLVRAACRGRVLIVVPPGEVAEFTAEEAHHLWTVLRVAVVDAAGIRRPSRSGRPSTNRAACGRFAVPCLDALGRDDRAVAISPLRDGQVRISAPAGGVAVLEPLNVGALRAALRDAACDHQQPLAGPCSPSRRKARLAITA